MSRGCPDYSWGYVHCPGPDMEPGPRGSGFDDSRCWKCEQVRKIETLEHQNAELKTLLTKFVDDVKCRLDHHDYCQTHMLEKPCSVAEARELLNPRK